jgi:DNA-binding PadR family transcriptional regulator
MRAINVTWYDRTNAPHKIVIRLSPLGAAQLIDMLNGMAWKNDLRTVDQIPREDRDREGTP